MRLGLLRPTSRIQPIQPVGCSTRIFSPAARRSPETAPFGSYGGAPKNGFPFHQKGAAAQKKTQVSLLCVLISPGPGEKIPTPLFSTRGNQREVLASWLVASLVGCLVGWLAGRPAGGQRNGDRWVSHEAATFTPHVPQSSPVKRKSWMVHFANLAKNGKDRESTVSFRRRGLT